MWQVISIVAVSLELSHGFLVISNEDTPELRNHLESFLVRVISIVKVHWIKVMITHGRDYRSVREISMQQLC